jgi:hypothetical protein
MSSFNVHMIACMLEVHITMTNLIFSKKLIPLTMACDTPPSSLLDPKGSNYVKERK